MAHLRPATSADLPAVLALLKDSSLPWQDIDAARLDGFLLAVDGESVLGTAGLERYGSDALLRSLAVRAEHRSSGLGTQLADAIEEHARHAGVDTLYLLTTTAADFFARRGHEAIPRQEAPSSLRGTTEFSTLCPSQALCMRKHINSNMNDKTRNILFLCTGNSARSIMAEALVTTMGKGRFKGFSAGSKPGGKVNPFAIEQVKKIGYPVDELRSKSWDEFAVPGAPHMDFIITVCDNAAGEACPIWPGHPATAHWGFEDPAAVEGTNDQKRAAFEKIFRQIEARMHAFVNLPLHALDREALQQEIRKIGEMQP